MGQHEVLTVRAFSVLSCASVCEEIAVELSVQGGLSKAYRKSQTCLQHALSYVDKQLNV